MTSDTPPVQVLATMTFSDDQLDMLRAVDARVQLRQVPPGQVPPDFYASAEVLYTMGPVPTPEQAPKLKWVALHSAGMEHVLDAPLIQSGQVAVSGSSGIHAAPMAEWALAMMLAFEVGLRPMLELQARKEWPSDVHTRFAPRGLRGKTVGIAGYGSIGRELGRQAAALGMTVLASKRDAMTPAADPNDYSEPGLGDPHGDVPARIYPAEALQSMARASDYLVLIMPLTAATRRVVNAQVLAAMPGHAVLVNMARGGVLDEEALVAALKDKRIAGAALDVFETEPLPTDSPLWTLPNVLISPHRAGNSADYNERAARLFAENLTRYLARRPLLNAYKQEHGY